MMSAFMTLREVSNNFENELRQFSLKLFSARIGENFEEALAKKIQDMTLFSSKLKLLRAKPLALTSQIKEESRNKALQEYGDEVMWKVLEQVTVKSLTQAHAVKALITTPDTNLAPELIERKVAIIENLLQYHHKESQLHHLDVLLKEREREHVALKVEWDRTVETLQELRDHQDTEESGNRGPLYLKLSNLVERLEVMRWLIGRLVCARGCYDWLADPHRRLSALALIRTNNTVDMFTQN